MVDAHAGAAPLAHDALVRGDLDDPAVADVGHEHVAVGQRIRVVGRVEVAGRRSRDPVVAVLPDHPARRDVDAQDDLEVLVVGGDGAPVGRDEGIVGAEGLAPGQAAGDREAPHDVSPVVHHDEPVVAPVGDEQAAGEGTRRRGGGGEHGARQW